LGVVPVHVFEEVRGIDEIRAVVPDRNPVRGCGGRTCCGAAWLRSRRPTPNAARSIDERQDEPNQWRRQAGNHGRGIRVNVDPAGGNGDTCAEIHFHNARLWLKALVPPKPR
jgi:hypothetical protein